MTRPGSGGVVHRTTIVAWLIPRVIGGILRVFGGLLGFSAFHLRLFEEALLLRQSFSLFAIFDLVLADESLRWMSKDALILAKFADPDVFQARRVMDVGILLLDFALPSCQRIDTSRRSLFLTSDRNLVSLRGSRLATMMGLRVHGNRHIRVHLAPLRG